MVLPVLPSECLLLAVFSTTSASTILLLSRLLRSPFDFGSNASLSTLRPSRYLQRRKTRYMVGLASPSMAGLSPARYVRLILAHAKASIDLFPILKQWKATISPGSFGDHLVILAGHLYGFRQFPAEDPYDFEREIKEGI